MEFPDLGKNCTEPTCNKLDFLPIKCDACEQIFCHEHYHYTIHNCPNAYKKNNQVPVCPLCNTPIPVGRRSPDEAVGAHIDNDCQADPAKNRRKVFTNKCSVKGCKIKEVIPVVCSNCKYNYCLKHRHPVDHSCQDKLGALRKRTADAAVNRQLQNGYSSSNFAAQIQGTMSDDEALAKALALSMQESTGNNQKTQEELDLALARQLQASESQTVGGARSRERCSLS